MDQHYGQHPVCKQCDALAAANTPEAQNIRHQRSQAAEAARVLAKAMNLPQGVIDRAGSYGSDCGDPIDAVRRAAEVDGIKV